MFVMEKVSWLHACVGCPPTESWVPLLKTMWRKLGGPRWPMVAKDPMCMRTAPSPSSARTCNSNNKHNVCDSTQRSLRGNTLEELQTVTMSKRSSNAAQSETGATDHCWLSRKPPAPLIKTRSARQHPEAHQTLLEWQHHVSQELQTTVDYAQEPIKGCFSSNAMVARK